MGHSVKRKEDPRFIRGAGEYIDDVVLPGMLWLDIVRSPYAHATIKGIDASRGPGDVPASSPSSPAPTSRRPASTGCRRSPATSRWCCRPTTVMYQAQEVAAVVATDRYAAADGVAAVDGRLRAAAGHRRSEEGAAARCVRAAARPRTGQEDQPHLALGERRQGGGRHGPGRRRRDASPRTSTSRASTSPRSRRAAASPTGTRSAAS